MRSTMSFRNIFANARFISSTMWGGVHSGKVHAEILEWLPHIINGIDGFPKSSVRCVDRMWRKWKQTGQHRFETPITRR